MESTRLDAGPVPPDAARRGLALTPGVCGGYKPSVPSIRELFDLSGRVAIVTGGSRGLGREMAEGLAEAGASLVLCARRTEWLTPAVEALRAAGHRVEAAVCDVADADQVQGVVDLAVRAFGRVDILVNNAGLSWGARPEDMPLDKWQSVIGANLTGAFLFSQAAGRDMLTRESGTIINIASVAGLQSLVRGPHYVGYAARDRKSKRLNSSHVSESRMPSSA